MSEQSEWVNRVETLTAGTMHEQIRSLMREAQDGLQRFSDVAAEQGSTLADAHGTFVEAQRSLEAGVENIRIELGAQLRSAAEDLALAREADQRTNAQERRAFRADLVEMTSALEARLDKVSERVELLREQMDDTAATADMTAKRILDMLTRAFAELGIKEEPEASPPPSLLEGPARMNGWHHPVATAG